MSSATQLSRPAGIAGWLRRRRWDRQPTDPAWVLIASTGEPIPEAAVNRAVTLSGGEPVAVVSIARIYGSALGLPNPGLMPTQKELGAQRARVAQTLAATSIGECSSDLIAQLLRRMKRWAHQIFGHIGLVGKVDAGFDQR